MFRLPKTVFASVLTRSPPALLIHITEIYDASRVAARKPVPSRLLDRMT